MKRAFAWLAHVWFPIAMIGLFLLALPGIILVILVLLGLDTQPLMTVDDKPVTLNGWLEQTLSISYQLAVNPWLALVLLCLPLLILLLYFLKLKRKPLQVPSTFLWKKSIEDVHVNTLFQWLRRNVLLVLQVLAMLFLIYSVLGVRIHGQVSEGRHYILLIDNSASMSATDVAPSRLEWARQEALKEIDAARDDDYGMVLVFNSKATTLQAYTNNRGKLRDAVRSIEPTQRTTRIDEALALADSLANPVRATEAAAVEPENLPPEQRRSLPGADVGVDTTVHLYSDGRYAKLSEAALASLNARLAGFADVQGKAGAAKLGNLNLRYHMAGKADAENVNNVGIISLSAVKYIEDPLKPRTEAQQLLVTVRVANYRPTEAKVKLALDVYVDGQLFLPKQQTLTIPPREVTPADDAAGKPEDDRPGERGMDVKLPALDLGKHIVLHAALENHKDDFALDDKAWLAVGVRRKAKVLIVGPANPALDAFFDQEDTARIASFERLKPADLATEEYRKHARGGDVDLVIFDRCAPENEAALPLANTFFIDQVPPPWHRSRAKFRPPVVIPSKANHPLLRYLTTLSEVRIAEAFEFNIRQDFDPEAGKQPRPEGEAEPDKSDDGKRPLPTMTRILESSEQRPLLFSLLRGPYVDVVQTFALANDRGGLDTDWPLQLSFPLFFRNVLYTLGKVDDAVRASGVQPGEPMVLRPEAGVQELEVTTPVGSIVKLARGLRPDFLFADTDRVGLYRYGAGKEGVRRSFAVNLLDTNESNIEPREEIRIGSVRMATGEQRQQPREIWKWILLLALALLTVEWIVYNRRVSV
jgi:hypothetical protein